MMKKVLFLFAALLFQEGGLLAQAPDFDVRHIPAALMQGAHAVVRLQHTAVSVESPSSMTYRVKRAVTILDKLGEEESVAYVYYNNSIKIKSLGAQLYDASGALMAVIREKDFKSQSAVPGGTLYADHFMKYYAPMVRSYPFTIVYEYELRNTNTHYIAPWIPLQDAATAVQESVYEIRCSPDFPVRILERNLPEKILREKAADGTFYRWQLNDLNALGNPPFMPPPSRFFPQVLVAPVNFEYEGIKGSFSNWDEYGRWVYKHLLEGRDELPAATAAQLSELLQGAESELEKVRRIYRFMQEKTRYVSIQIGIGGVQPIPAEKVDQLSYGDCKGLVNYTMALLKQAGIRSIYTEVYGGSELRDYDRQFASFFQGNHIILCVPLESDTVWLECTSRDAPFGHLGRFTDNRNALLITPEGGFVVKTPSHAEAGTRRQANLDVSPGGDMEGSVHSCFSGASYDNRSQLLHARPQEAEALLKEIYPLSNLQIERWNISQVKEGEPLTTEDLQLRVPGFAQVSGKRLFLPLNALNRQAPLPKQYRERTIPVFIRDDYVEADTFSYRLPADYQAEYLPEKVEFSSRFGSFRMEVVQEGDKLSCRRLLHLDKGEYPAESYSELEEFFRKVSSADLERAVFILP